MKKSVDIFSGVLYNNSCVTKETRKNKSFGVWLSLARAPGLGPGGRRFESCHPESPEEIHMFMCGCSSVVEH